MSEDYGEFVEELRLLAETVLERVEPALRQAAVGIDQQEWAGCSWCPVCAAVALLRGEHHDLVAVLADHGTAMVTVLREAIAGIPVEPVMPEDFPMGGQSRRQRPPAPKAEPRPSPKPYQPIPVTIKD